ncbi:MAG TPA: DUF3048 domain-containing protein [Candidatus Dormibacteraeota bacterium]|nr:DUF3048 domain-containing protein [Candidatus Dormibacteraeota bacterium]
MKRCGLACALLLLLAACGSAAPTSSPTPRPGLAAPAIIQVENSPAGRPQSGLAAANIVYEYVAEGGIGRFSLMFFGAPPPAQSVGPVRSARTVTVALAGLYQGFLAYSGASTYISGLLGRASFPSFNETTAQGNLFRTSSRAPPHNLYTDGQHIANLARLAAQPPVAYQLWPRTTHPTGGAAVTTFTAQVSFFERPLFTWQADRGGFTRTEDSGLVVDPVTQQPLILPTVIVQQVAVTTDPNVVDVTGQLGVDHQVTGSGKAQVFTGGREYQATWTQPAHGPPQFTLADGSPAPIAPGEVWISLVPTCQPAGSG